MAIQGKPGQLVFMLAFGVLCATLASSRGRSPVAWFCIGFVFSCFALVFLLVLPDLSLEEERPAPAPATPPDDLWYYVDRGSQAGPVTYGELARLWQHGLIVSTTFVWRDGMKEWRRINEVPDLEGRLRA